MPIPPTPTQITLSEMQMYAREYLSSAKALITTHPAQAIFLCSYYLDLSIKVAICRTLKWNHFPPIEFADKDLLALQDMTHLLLLSGRLNELSTTSEYAYVNSINWSGGGFNVGEAEDYIQNCQTLVNQL